MSKIHKSTIILAIIMLVSHRGIDAIFVRYFAEWNEQMGILAFIFNIILTAIIGFAFALLTKDKAIKSGDVMDNIDEIEVKDERNVMLRTQAGLSMWRINLFLLLALLLLMITLKIPVAAWCILLLIIINLIGFFVCFDREDKKN